MIESLAGLIAIVLGLLMLIGLFLPWFHRRQLRELRERVDILADRVEQLHTQMVFARPAEAAPAPAPAPAPAEAPPVSQPAPAAVLPTPVTYAEPDPAPVSAPADRGSGFEFRFGAQLPVWIGGIALALAGFYFVRYSIEVGLLGPGVRVVLGLLFGGGLIAAARRTGPLQPRIGQALAGAGIADLYMCLFAATSLYDLIPVPLGFAGMVGVTLLAMVMALRHGMPIAVMGLTGGFITPLLVGSTAPNTPLLLTYLYLLFAGLLWLIRRNQWWILALLLAPFVLLWAIVLLVTAPAADAVFIALFLLALGCTAVSLTREVGAMAPDKQIWGLTAPQAMRGLTGMIIGLGAVMVGVATAKGGFGWMDRGLLLALAAGGMGLAWFDHTRYRQVPWLTLIVSLFTLASWTGADLTDRQLTLLLFALLQAGGAAVLLWRSPQPLFWSLLGAVAITGHYLLAYASTGGEPARLTLWPFIAPEFWGTLALGIASAAVVMAGRVYRLTWASDRLRQQLLAVFAATASGFIALGLTVGLEREFLSVAIAAEVAALAWLNRRLTVTALRPLAGAGAALFLLLLLPQVALLAQLTLYSLFEARVYLVDSLPMVSWPFFQLGLPAALLLTASWWLRQQRDGRLVQALEAGSIALAGIMGYYLMRHAFHPDENVLFAHKAGFIERGLFTNVLLVFGLACLNLGVRFDRRTVVKAGLAVGLAGAFRLVWFDLLLDNPLWDNTQLVGSLPLANGLGLTYLLPLLWLELMRRQLAVLDWRRWQPALVSLMGALAFAFANLTLRHLFHGDPPATGGMGSGELYSYSLLWLVLALTVLVAGTRYRLKALRVTALGLMVVTIGKVFLIDAAALTGLWRVFSFLGLGLCLIGLSWFYNRVIGRSSPQP